jgi:hypothetical protein
MKLEMDTIKFEYRSEVDNVSVALQEWLDKHKTDEKANNVKELIDKLETLYMSW